MEAFSLLIKLICAHLCADFVFQTDGLNNGKHNLGKKGIGFNLLHSAIHSMTAYLFAAEWTCWQIPIVIFFSHCIIDLTKCTLKKESLFAFLVDQFCHFLVIFVLWYVRFGKETEWSCFEWASSIKVWGTMTAYILMLQPSSIFLNLFLHKWVPGVASPQSLPKAGQWIGFLERILILTFVLVGSIEGVGFLLAAKSVFRFGELNKAEEIRTTEYVLIGTLASFTIAILTGVAIINLF